VSSWSSTSGRCPMSQRCKMRPMISNKRGVYYNREQKLEDTPRCPTAVKKRPIISYKEIYNMNIEDSNRENVFSWWLWYLPRTAIWVHKCDASWMLCVVITTPRPAFCIHVWSIA
jgi:hypothetical protein